MICTLQYFVTERHLCCTRVVRQAPARSRGWLCWSVPSNILLQRDVPAVQEWWDRLKRAAEDGGDDLYPPIFCYRRRPCCTRVVRQAQARSSGWRWWSVPSNILLQEEVPAVQERWDKLQRVVEDGGDDLYPPIFVTERHPCCTRAMRQAPARSRGWRWWSVPSNILLQRDVPAVQEWWDKLQRAAVGSGVFCTPLYFVTERRPCCTERWDKLKRPAVGGSDDLHPPIFCYRETSLLYKSGETSSSVQQRVVVMICTLQYFVTERRPCCTKAVRQAPASSSGWLWWSVPSNILLQRDVPAVQERWDKLKRAAVGGGGGCPRAGAPVVRQPRHHALVERSLAQRGVRQLDGVQGTLLYVVQ